MVTVASENTSPPAAREWLPFPDHAKLVAIVAVVLIHVAGPINEGYGNISYGAWLASTVLESASRWAVPVFVMLSGMLLLGNTRLAPAEFYRRRASRILLPLVFWSIFYIAFRILFIHEDLSVLQGWFAFAGGQPYYHLYFLFIIAGLYLIAPYLARGIADLDQRQLRALTIGSLVFSMLAAGISTVFPGGGSNAVTQFVPYIGYFIAGRYFGQIALDKARLRNAVIIYVAAVLAVAGGTALWVSLVGLQAGRYLYGYQSPFVIVMSLSVFVVLQGVSKKLAQRRHRLSPGRLKTLGNATFGVFLIHPIFFEWWIRTSVGRVPTESAALALWIVVTVVGVVALAFVASLLLGKIPGLRRLV